MSDDQRITKVEKEKDPRRVEAGNRLGAISRAAKERKARDREDRAAVEDRTGKETMITTIDRAMESVSLHY